MDSYQIPKTRYQIPFVEPCKQSTVHLGANPFCCLDTSTPWSLTCRLEASAMVRGPGGKGTPVTYEVIGASSAPDLRNSSAASGSSLSPSPRSDSSRSSWASCLLPKKRSYEEMEADKQASEYVFLMAAVFT